MQRDIIVKSRGLGGSSDLTLLAKIKPGFIDSLESVTFKTRIKRVLETLHGARTSSHEYATARLLSDSVERVGAIHSVRVAVLEPEDNVMLAVTFDGSWESYIRVLWDKVGSLLDLIFCGTVGYVTATDHSFDQWHEWARGVQVETGFFYGPPDSTARDALYQRRIERMRSRGVARDLNASELNELRAVLPSAEMTVGRLVDKPQLEPDDPPVQPVGAPRMLRERLRNGLQSLAALYRLVELHPPKTGDAEVLRRATLDLLLEFVQMRDAGLIDDELTEEYKRFPRQLDWLFPLPSKALPTRERPALEAGEPEFDALRGDIQGGILRSYDEVTHGLLLMFAFDGASGAVAFLKHLESPNGRLTVDSDPHTAVQDLVFRNLALTLWGLRALGLSEDSLELFPEEFRQGMAARAGLLGDVRNNHPRRWRLPGRFAGIDADPGPEMIEMEGVHAVIQVRCKGASAAELATFELKERAHPLRSEVERLLELCDEGSGVRLLAVQSLRRRYVDRTGQSTQVESDTAQAPVIVEHFGYADGDGQPEFAPAAGSTEFQRNRIQLGELVLGHCNGADFAPDARDPKLPKKTLEGLRWLTNGSFLAMRKYRQYVGRLESAVDRTAAQMASRLGGKRTDYTEIVYAKIMGRYRDGTPLVPIIAGKPNVFTYDLDRTGQQCPLHAHVRLANPRMKPGEAARMPRLMRRSMSYGPQRPPGTARNDVDHGLVFMAYSASLGEQFEVVQRWLVGGNSTGSSSGQSCPIVGVPENGLSRHFQFEHPDESGAAHVFRVDLEDTPALFEEPSVLARLEWGLYLFTPSVTVVASLREVASKAATAISTAVPWDAKCGAALIAALIEVKAKHGKGAAVEAWKAALEDPQAIDRLESAAIWASIRDDHGGVLRTPYGVLVAARELVAQVFLDPQHHYSVCGQLERMKKSFGEISLGLDAGPDYDEQSGAINTAITNLTATPAGKEYVFQIAFDAATRKIDEIVKEAKEQSLKVRDLRFEVGFEARELLDEVLADLSDAWFGLRDSERDRAGRKQRLCRGGTDWAWKPGQPPLYPGHFTALSRYMFQPRPGGLPIKLGRSYGKALRKAMNLFVADHRPNGAAAQRLPLGPDGQPAPIARAAFEHALHGADNDFVAKNMVGVLMGFNPTITGAILNVLREWHREGRIGALRAQLAGRCDYASAHAVLTEPMAAAARMRPMPQLGWRTATAPDAIGTGKQAVAVKKGDLIVLGIVSGTQQSLADGRGDARLMFGGVRCPAPRPHPTHACPGYEAGIEAMLGTLTALLSRPETLRPGAAPLTFLLEGDSEFKPPALPRGGPPTPTGLIFAWGDSWLDFAAEDIVDLGKDLRDWLEIGGFTIPQTYCKWSVWPKVKTMANDTGGFCADLDNALLTPNPPIAILLSAGGNDSTGSTLEGLLNEKEAPLPGRPARAVIDSRKLDAHIAALRKGYCKILDDIKGVLVRRGAMNLPVIVHGYDHPIPQGRGIRGGDYAKKWMFNPFRAKKYVCTPDADLAVATKAMAQLIDALNVMLSGLHATYPFIHYVDLRGTIEAGRKTNPSVDWADDLHPEEAAFKLLAGKIEAEIIRAIAAVTAAAPVPAPAASATSSA